MLHLLLSCTSEIVTTLELTHVDALQLNYSFIVKLCLASYNYVYGTLGIKTASIVPKILPFSLQSGCFAESTYH